MRFLAVFRDKRAWSALIWALLFSLALALTYWPAISGGPDRFGGRYDVYRYFTPNAFYMDTAIHGGEFPLWNPLVYCGMPFAANPQTAAFYPPNIVRSLFNVRPTPSSTQQSLIILMGLHLLLAAGGAYLLGRAHGMGRPGAYACAFAFAFSALMVRRTCEYHFLYTLNWLPLILLFIKRAIDHAGLLPKLKNAAVAGGLMGVAILGGFFQIVVYMAVAAAAYGVAYRLLHMPSAGARIAQFRRDGLAFVVAVMTAGAIGAAILVPAAELAAFTARQPDEAIGQYSDLRQGGVSGFVQGVVVYAGMRYHPEAIRASGVAALLLSLAAIVLGWRRDVAAFLAAFLVLVDCSFGPPMPVARLIEWVTPFATSASTRAFDVALLPLSMLAGFGVSAMTANGGRLTLAVRTLLLTALGTGILALLSWSLSHKPFLVASPVVFILPATALVILAVGPWAPGRRVRVSLEVLLAALVFCETLAWNRHYVPWLIRGGRPVSEARAGAWPVEPRNQRNADPLANNGVFELKPLMNGYDPLHLREVREVVSGPPRDRRYHRLVNAEESTAASHRGNLFLKRPFWLAQTWAAGSLPPKDKLFPAATTVFLHDGEGIDIEPVSRAGVTESSLSAGAVRITRAGGIATTATILSGTTRRVMSGVKLPGEIAGRPVGSAGAIHRALVLHYTSTCSAKVETQFKDGSDGRLRHGKSLDIASSGNYAGQAEVPVPDLAAAEVTMSITAGRGGSFRLTEVEVLADPRDEDELIRILRWGANAVEVEARDLPGGRLLLFTDAAYPGWQAFVDSEPARIHRADDVFKAVYVPAGTHRIRFVFRPGRVYAGIAISLNGLAALILAGAALRLWPRTKGSQI